MSSDRIKIVQNNFLTSLKEQELLDIELSASSREALKKKEAIRIFDSQLTSRHLDYASRILQARGEAFYTIGSAGHEGNAAIAAALKPDDMAFLHYRDAAFFIERAKQYPGTDYIRDMLLSFAASKDDPISEGRHKVLGSKEMFVPPQTSTIASHLPKAVGAAYSIGLNKKLKNKGVLASDGVVICSFGDASVNHSTALGAINTACWTSYQGVPMPIIFICEDNGIGISTQTPKGWIEKTYQDKAGLKYFSSNGLDIFETYKVTREVQNYVRVNKKPAFLHFRCTRLFGHAGADMQTAYMTQKEIENVEAQDPLLYTASLLIKEGILSAADVTKLYHEIESKVANVAEKVVKRPKLKNAKEVMQSIVPPARKVAKRKAPSQSARKKHFDRELSLQSQPAHMAKLINWTLHDIMLQYPEIILCGEDIGQKGGVYNVTANLHDRFGAPRVINTLLDEQSILGLSIGMAHNNLLPIPEIQFLAYLHNAEDQIRGEAATLSFFSSGQYTNPMVVRIAGLAYQKGFGGHFHNDNSFNVLRDIPGVIVACPSNGLDASAMLRECVRLAREEQRVVIFLEPIALYMTRDLHEEKDGQWSFIYNDVEQISFGNIGQYGKGKELAIITYGNGYYLSRQAAKSLEAKGIKLRIIDLRWLLPLPTKNLLKAIKGCQNILIVDECRKTGSISEELMTLLKDYPNVKRLTAEDSFIPLGRAFASTLPSVDSIINAATELMD